MYRGKKKLLFEALIEGTHKVCVPPRDLNEDDDVLFGIKWRTFYRYIADFRKDGYPVHKDIDEYFIPSSPNAEDGISEYYTVNLTYVQMRMLLDLLRSFCGGFEKKDLSKNSLIRSIWEEIEASLYGWQDLNGKEKY